MIEYEVIICRISPSYLNLSLPTYLPRRTCVEQRVNGRVPSVFPNDLLILYPATDPRPQSSSSNSACRCKAQLSAMLYLSIVFAMGSTKYGIMLCSCRLTLRVVVKRNCSSPRPLYLPSADWR